MNQVTQTMIDAAVAKLAKNKNGGFVDYGDALLQSIETALAGALPADLADWLGEYGVKASPEQKLAALLTKFKKALYGELRVKRFANGSFSILKDSPIKALIATYEEDDMTTKTQNATKSTAAPRNRRVSKKAATGKRGTPAAAKRREAAKKDHAKKVAAKKAAPGKGRAKTYSLNITAAALKKLETTPQAMAILQALKAAGGKKVERADLLKAMEKTVTSNQTMSAILAFYSKRLIADGHMTTAS